MEPDKDDLNFTLERQERPVTISGQTYVLIELDGKQRDNYLNGIGQRLRHTPDGKPAGLKSFDGLQASLIALTMRDSAGKAVPIDVIQSWPARVVSKIYDAAREMNGLGDDEEVAKKGNE